MPKHHQEWLKTKNKQTKSHQLSPAWNSLHVLSFDPQPGVDSTEDSSGRRAGFLPSDLAEIGYLIKVLEAVENESLE